MLGFDIDVDVAGAVEGAWAFAGTAGLEPGAEGNAKTGRTQTLAACQAWPHRPLYETVHFQCRAR